MQNLKIKEISKQYKISEISLYKYLKQANYFELDITYFKNKIMLLDTPKNHAFLSQKSDEVSKYQIEQTQLKQTTPNDLHLTKDFKKNKHLIESLEKLRSRQKLDK